MSEIIAKHTPGPWTIGGVQPWIQWMQFEPEQWSEMQKANARLIAAAPDLLEACDELLGGMIDGSNRTTKNVTTFAIEKIKAAVAKSR